MHSGERGTAPGREYVPCECVPSFVVVDIYLHMEVAHLPMDSKSETKKKKSHRNKLGSYRQACGRPLGTITKASLGAGWRGAEHPERVPVPHLFTFSPEESSFSSGLTPRLWLLRAPRCSMDGWSQGLPHDSAEPRRPGQGAWGLRKGFGDN